MNLTVSKVLAALGEAGLEGVLTSEQVPSLLEFTRRMLTLNETLNLTRWTQDEDVMVHHFLDSAQVLPELRPLLQSSQKWLDLGTGCGFPGALLGAAYPSMDLTLFDSVLKKTKALEGCLEGLGWKVRTQTGRAEDLGRDPKTRETWDGVLVRAVADLPVVLEYGLPLLKSGGYLVDWMTEDQAKVVDKCENALKVLSGKIAFKKVYSLPGLTQKRCLLFVEKLGKTPDPYPRPVGKPSRKPL